MQNDLIAALGASPVGMPAPEIFDALERGVINGLMIANSGLVSFNLFEVLDAGVLCNCYVASQFLTMNLDTWESLSPEQQAAIDELAGRPLSLAEAYDNAYTRVIDRLEEEGIDQVVLEGDELQRWRDVGDQVIEDWIVQREADGIPAQAMYDRLLELVGG